MDRSALEKLARRVRYLILKMTHQAGSGHPTSSFSAVELMTMLFFKYLRSDLDHPANSTNDRVIFSKGHASALLYSLYAAAGKLTEEELMGYRTFECVFEGHPTKRFPFTEVATGSLGQGLSVGAGEAMALHLQISNDALPAGRQELRMTNSPHVLVLLGDGELAEGSVWEAAAWASLHKLANLTAIVDVNRFGQSQETMYGHDVQVYARRFEAFGWNTIVIDGHDWAQIDAAYQKALDYRAGPVAILAKTIKGHGIPYWEDKDGWHNRMLPKEELAKALVEFGGEGIVGVVQKPAFSVANAHKNTAVLPNSEVLQSLVDARAPSVKNSNLPTLSSFSYEKETLVPTKKAFGNAIERLGSVYPDLMVLDGDVANSTHTDQFGKKFPERFLQMYIAEQNMVGVAIGLARRGFRPFVTTFGCFLSRAHDQIRMIPLSDATVYFNGCYVGVSMGKDGPSQMALEDIALFRSVHGSTVLYPADPYATEALTEEMLKLTGVVYIRTTREPTPVIYTKDDQFPVGGSKELRMTNDELRMHEVATIVAVGITLHEALKAQKQLADEGIGVRVIDCYSIKPIDEKTLEKAAKETKAIVVVEDHYSEGGLGEAVKSVLLASDSGDQAIKLVHLAVYKQPRSGTPEELLDFEEISAKKIIETVRRLVKH